MCGRYMFTADEDVEEIMQIIKEVNERQRGAFTGGEIFPSQYAPVLLPQNDMLCAQLLQWGFAPPFMKGRLLINARAESVVQKQVFRDSFAQRRCLVPVTGYFEWKDTGEKVKEKYLFTLPGAALFFLAGLWQQSGDADRYVILTTEANASARDVHGRMPVIIPQSSARRWTDDADTALQLLRAPMPALASRRTA